jgi:hypothetical protein
LLHREKKDSEIEVRKAEIPLWFCYMKVAKRTTEKSEDFFRYNPSPGKIQNRELLERKEGGGLEKERGKF